MRLNKRGVLYVTEVCNHRCKFCYYKYLNRKAHTPLSVVKARADELRFNHGLTHVDLTGIGEPTFHPQISEIIKYCAEIGLKPAMITNGSRPGIVEKLIKEGYLEDVILSIHSIGAAYEELTGGNWDKFLQTMEILKETKMNWRGNVCVVKENLPYLKDTIIALHAHGGRLMNFLVFNPHEGTDLASKENEIQASYSECAVAIKEAIDEAEKLGVLIEVRYIPVCTMKGYEKYVMNFSQWIYDPYSWEEAGGNGKEPFKTEEEYQSFIKQKVSCNYKSGNCDNCTLKSFCDGIYPQYKNKYGVFEFIPYSELISHAMHFRKVYMDEHPEVYGEEKNW